MDIYRNINGVYRCINNPRNNQTLLLPEFLENRIKIIADSQQSNPLQEYNIFIQQIFPRGRELLF